MLAKGARIVKGQVGGLRVVGIARALRLRGDGTEIGAAQEGDKLVGPEIAHPHVEPVVQAHIHLGINAVAALEGPQRACLLRIAQGQHLGIHMAHHLVPHIPAHAHTRRSIAKGLDGGHRILLATAVLNRSLNGHIDVPARLLAVQPKARGQTHHEGFLMRVALEDKALPVHPRINMGRPRVGNELKTKFGVGRQHQFGIVEGLREAVRHGAVQVAQHKVDATQPQLRTKPRHHVRPLLVLIALPLGNIVVGIVGKPVRTAIYQGMYACLNLQVVQGLIRQLGRGPETGQTVALHHGARKLIVLKERPIVHLQPQLAHRRTVQGIVQGRKGFLHLRKHAKRAKGQQEGENDFVHRLSEIDDWGKGRWEAQGANNKSPTSACKYNHSCPTHHSPTLFFSKKVTTQVKVVRSCHKNPVATDKTKT